MRKSTTRAIFKRSMNQFLFKQNNFSALATIFRLMSYTKVLSNSDSNQIQVYTVIPVRGWADDRSSQLLLLPAANLLISVAGPHTMSSVPVDTARPDCPAVATPHCTVPFIHSPRLTDHYYALFSKVFCFRIDAGVITIHLTTIQHKRITINFLLKI